ncbi:MAG: MarR family winged helix-turn-helix transcriptional regulator [Stackebrandtia sp.]
MLRSSRQSDSVPLSCGLREVIGQLTAVGVDLETIAGRFAQGNGLHPTDVRALRVLSDSTTEVTAGELGERLALSSGATTRMIDRMERAGYLTRVRSADDRRVVHVQMSRQAWIAAGAFFGRLGPVIDDAIGDDFTTDELAIVSRFLTAAAAAVRTAARSTTTVPPSVP